MRQLFFFVHLSERLEFATVDEHNDEPVVAFAQLAQVQREDERGWFCDPPGGVRRVGGSPSRRPAALRCRGRCLGRPARRQLASATARRHLADAQNVLLGIEIEPDIAAAASAATAV